jgi:ribosomal protein S18 acetylase RimI-like enzyme
MATWQFSMHLVPREGLLTVRPDLAAAFSDDEVDMPVWTTTQPAADFVTRLSRLLPEVECWNPASRQWGATDRTTVQVSYTDGADGRVDGIWARIDLRESTADVIEVIGVLASLATDSDGWWVGGDSLARVPIGQTSGAIGKAIEGSAAARFVADPAAFLTALRETQDSPRGGVPRTAVTIRRAVPADAAGIAVVMAVIAAERIHSAIDRAWSGLEQERYLESLSSRETVHLAIDATEGIVGLQTMDRWSPITSMAHVGQVGTFLLPDWRRLGIGRQLWIATQAFARDAGYRKLVIQVRASNTNAQAFYQGLGFRVVGRLTRQVSIDGVEDDELMMEQFV